MPAVALVAMVSGLCLCSGLRHVPADDPFGKVKYSGFFTFGNRAAFAAALGNEDTEVDELLEAMLEHIVGAEKAIEMEDGVWELPKSDQNDNVTFTATWSVNLHTPGLDKGTVEKSLSDIKVDPLNKWVGKRFPNYASSVTVASVRCMKETILVSVQVGLGESIRDDTARENNEGLDVMIKKGNKMFHLGNVNFLYENIFVRNVPEGTQVCLVRPHTNETMHTYTTESPLDKYHLSSGYDYVIKVFVPEHEYQGNHWLHFDYEELVEGQRTIVTITKAPGSSGAGVWVAKISSDHFYSPHHHLHQEGQSRTFATESGDEIVASLEDDAGDLSDHHTCHFKVDDDFQSCKLGDYKLEFVTENTD